MDEEDNYNYIINFLKLTFYETEKFTQNNALAICPKMEVVELDMFQPILACSLPMSETEITDENDILAPGLGDDDLSLFGL